MTVKQRADYTFKFNKKLGRHGWLRLTPAYSVKIVTELLQSFHDVTLVLDPFSGTATTGLVAAHLGLSAHCVDVNPFLVWFGNTKCRNYRPEALTALRAELTQIANQVLHVPHHPCWLPNIHNIDRWWSRQTQQHLSVLRQLLVDRYGEPARDDSATIALVWIAFCRLVIELSSAAFNHVSMSFHDVIVDHDAANVSVLFLQIANSIIDSAKADLTGSAEVRLGDSRQLDTNNAAPYSHVITSPPYPNRISYVRELRPYMYWLKFLTDGSHAGELDWQSIGGTWGIATSRLKEWQPAAIPLPRSVRAVTDEIRRCNEKNAGLMANYVGKYFHDMSLHLSSLRNVLAPGAELAYIVGNSSFYGVHVPTQLLLVDLLNELGFTNSAWRVIRKRNSKKELFEYCVFASWQGEARQMSNYFQPQTPVATQLSLFNDVY